MELSEMVQPNLAIISPPENIAAPVMVVAVSDSAPDVAGMGLPIVFAPASELAFDMAELGMPETLASPEPESAFDIGKIGLPEPILAIPNPAFEAEAIGTSQAGEPDLYPAYYAIEPKDETDAVQGLVQYATVPRLLFGLVFLAGIFIGSLALGFLIWTQSQEITADRLSPDEQRQIVLEIADRYWQTADLGGAQHDLADWDKAEILELLREMQYETPDREERRHLAALSDGLNAPTYDTSIATFLVGHPFLLLAFALPFLPLLAAIGYAVRISRRGKDPTDEDMEQLLTQDLGLPAASGESPVTGSGIAGDSPDSDMAALGSPSGAATPEDILVAQSDGNDEEPEGTLGMTIGDLASVFEEEDVSLETLQELSKRLSDIPVQDLVTAAGNVIRTLGLLNRHDAPQVRATDQQA